MKNANIFLALTGNIGSGKTTVLNLFENIGFNCFNADKIVHSMFEKEHPLYSSIAQKIDNYLGTNFINEALIDRSILRTYIIKDDKVLKSLADIVHPFLVNEISKLKNHGNIIIEVPLLFEQNIAYLFDKTILVVCCEEERFKRISSRNSQWSQEYIKKLMNSQMSQEEKIKKADYIINNEDYESLPLQISNILSNIKKNINKPF